MKHRRTGIIKEVLKVYSFVENGILNSPDIEVYCYVLSLMPVGHLCSVFAPLGYFAERIWKILVDHGRV
jgi:hypothetical protein